MKVDIKNRFTGEVLVSYENSHNKLCAARSSKANLRDIDLIASDLSDYDLTNSDLSGRNLRGCNFIGTNFSGSDLSDSDLSGVYFRYSNLSNSDLSESDLSGSDLLGSDLSGVKINKCIGDMEYIFSMQLEKFKISFTKDELAIDCEQHPIKDWKEFDDEKISSMHTSALIWWNKWRAFIFKAIELSTTDRVA